MHPANIRYLLGCLLGPQTSRDSSACRVSYSLMLNMWHPLGRVLWSPAEPDPEWGSFLGLSGVGGVMEGFPGMTCQMVQKADLELTGRRKISRKKKF